MLEIILEEVALKKVLEVLLNVPSSSMIGLHAREICSSCYFEFLLSYRADVYWVFKS